MTFNQLKKNLRKDFIHQHEIRVALIGDTAVQLLSTAIVGYGVEKNVKINLYEAPYNQVELQFKNPNSELHSFKADYIIIFESETKLKADFYKTSDGNRKNFARVKAATIEEYVSIANELDAKLLYFNFCEVNDGVFGNYGSQYAESYIYQCRLLNQNLADLAIATKALYIVDLLSLQNTFGTDFIRDSDLLTQADMYFTMDFLPIVAKFVYDIIDVQLGYVKKCLILDLDNTLWGGVIGDDGMTNIQIGGLGNGKIFSKIQQWAKELKKRGIILCVASKNTESIALEPFQHHRDMVLKEDDISIFMANWDNKVANIQKIQEILNIGFDSMVFVDDNPFEREMVKTHLPKVTVPNLPDNASEYLDYLISLNLFEPAGISSGDANRGEQYREEVNRVKAKAYFSNEEEFLESLEMSCTVEPLNSFNLPRISQLSLRSNQFNLRTVRFDEEGLKKFGDADDQFVLALSLKDKYGDHGLISALFFTKKTKTLFIDNWIMSCRVLKRGMEKFTINTLVDFAKSMDCNQIQGTYIPTSKNTIVADHYKDLGFTYSSDVWTLKTNDYQPFKNQIK